MARQKPKANVAAQTRQDSDIPNHGGRLLSPSRHPQNRRPESYEQVKGARKIWGTLRSTTTTAIERALSTLTKISSKDVVVKRKYKTAQRDPHRVTKWWFVLRGKEEVLQQLQEEWPSVALQMTWNSSLFSTSPHQHRSLQTVCPHLVLMRTKPLRA